MAHSHIRIIVHLRPYTSYYQDFLHRPLIIALLLLYSSSHGICAESTKLLLLDYKNLLRNLLTKLARTASLSTPMSDVFSSSRHKHRSPLDFSRSSLSAEGIPTKP